MNAKHYEYISFNWACYFEVFGTDLSQFISIFLIILRLNNNGKRKFQASLSALLQIAVSRVYVKIT